MKVKYITNISSPLHMFGRIGDVKDIPDMYAQRLLNNGYVIKLKKAKNDIPEKTMEETIDEASAGND